MSTYDFNNDSKNSRFKHLEDELSILIDDAISKIKVEDYDQEPNYVAALLGKMAGEKINIDNYELNLRTIAFNDRGSKSIESECGADFAIITTLKDWEKEIKKIVLVQAKKNVKKNDVFLSKQYEKMGHYTDQRFIMETPHLHGSLVILENPSSNNKINFSNFLVQMLRCNFGDKNEVLIETVNSKKIVPQILFADFNAADQ